MKSGATQFFHVQLDGHGPLSTQLYRALRGAILAGRIPAGARLPSSRGLAIHLGLSRNTILLAFEQLRSEGYAVGRQGSGTYVPRELPDDLSRVATPDAASARSSKSAPPVLSRFGRTIASWEASWEADPRSPRFDFRYGRPSFEDFPHATWRRLLSRRARAISERDFDYGPPAGHPELRSTIAAYLRSARGVSCSDDQVIVVRGSQQAIDLCARILLDPGDRVIIEDPCYPGARGVFVASGARVVTAPVDVDGMDVRSRGFRSGGARLAYTTPSHQYPSGVVLALPRRLELLEWASRELGYILEDDYDSEYRYFGRPIESLQGLDGGERVIYTGSFSKLVFPALRLGFVVLPKALLPAFSAAKGLSDAGSATLEQLAMTDFIRDGHFARHVRRSRLRNAARRAALLEAIADFLGDRVEVSGGTAGIHLLIRLPRVAAEKTDLYARRAREARVGVYSAASCFHRRMKSASFVLGYNALTTEEIREGIEALSGAW